MRSVAPIVLDSQQLLAELTALDKFLSDNAALKERDHVLPFFQSHPQLVAALGWMNAASGRPDRYATELDLFSDFSCDAAAGHSGTGAFTLIEFEDARENSVFKALESGKSLKEVVAAV
jgi:hypothetical protein